jgi:hypothetical protein
MGDELAMGNDPGWARDPARGHSTTGQLIRAGRIELPPWSFVWLTDGG